MVFNNWTQEETDTLTALYKQGQPLSVIAKAIPTRSIGAIARKLKRIHSSEEAIEIPECLITEPTFDKDEIVTSPWDSIKDIQDLYKSESKFLNIGLPTGTDKGRKILSLSDIHFPFARLDLLNEAIETHRDADIVVLNGDIIDGYIFSTFQKSKTVAAIDEYRTAFEFVEMLSKMFPAVLLIEGNHDVRPLKALKRLDLSKDHYSAFSPNLLARIANGERLDEEGNVIELVKFDNVYYPALEPWWAQIGQTLFIHPHNRGSSKPAYTVSSWAKKFQERLPPGSFDSVVCGHTHQLSRHVQSNLLLIEQGCLCDYMAYSWQPTAFYHSSAMNGYAIIYQNEKGETDFNKSNCIYQGQLLPIDKPVFGSINF